MLFYFVIFCVVGLVIGFILRDPEKGIPAILIISVLWGLVYSGVWAIAAFIELALGYGVAMFVVNLITRAKE